MKKFYLILAVATATLFALSSCNKPGGGDSGKDTEVVMKDPATKAAAKTVKFTETAQQQLPKYKSKNVTYVITKLEFTEDKMCLIQKRVVETKVEVGDIINEVLSYTESGGTYNVNGFGTVIVSGNNVQVIPAGDENKGNEFSGTANVAASTTSSTAENNFARTWRVDNVVLSVSGNGVSIMKSFNGCNLYEMAQYAASNGVSQLASKLPQLEGYNVQYVMFTGADSFIISFSGASAITGTFKLPADKKLNYDFSASDNPFFHGTASGSYEFPADKKMSVVLNVTLEGYTGSVEMNLTAAN